MPDASDILLQSPDRRTTVRVALGDWYAGGVKLPAMILLRLSFSGHGLLQTSRLGIRCGDQPLAPAGWTLLGVKRSRARCAWASPAGDAAQPDDACNGLVLRLREQGDPARRVDVTLLCRDAGLAIRARMPRQRGLAQLPPPAIEGALLFPAGTQAWSEQDGAWQPRPVDALPLPVGHLCTLNYTHGRLLCLLPPPSHISGSVRLAENRSGTGTPGAPTEAHASPWQVFLMGDRPVDIPASAGRLLPEMAAVHTPVPAGADAVWNCLAPFVAAAGERGPGAAVACPATPAHRLGAAIVCGAGAARWDETRFLRGEIGAYLVVARRQGATWRVGAITAAEGRVLTVRLEEILPLRAHPLYSLVIQRDPLPGEASDDDGIVRERFDGVTPVDAPRIELPPGGGFLLQLEPEA